MQSFHLLKKPFKSLYTNKQLKADTFVFFLFFVSFRFVSSRFVLKIEQDMPDEVWEAFEFLCGLGYTKMLIK